MRRAASAASPHLATRSPSASARPSTSRHALATAELGPRSRQEFEAVLAAIVAAVAGFVVALLTLLAFEQGTHPISGTRSIGTLGAIVAAVSAAVSFAIASLRSTDPATLVGEQIDTRVLGTLVPAFLVVGVLFSMLTASDPDWWQLHFSSLGAGGGISGFAFNMTLVVSGLMVATMAAYIGHDLEQVSDAGPRVAWVGGVCASQAIRGGGGESSLGTPESPAKRIDPPRSPHPQPGGGGCARSARVET